MQKVSCSGRAYFTKSGKESRFLLRSLPSIDNHSSNSGDCAIELLTPGNAGIGFFLCGLSLRCALCVKVFGWGERHKKTQH